MFDFLEPKIDPGPWLFIGYDLLVEILYFLTIKSYELMNDGYRKLVRTLMVYLPVLKRAKPSTQRIYHWAVRTPFEKDFYALRLFPNETGDLYLDIGGNHGLAVQAIRIFKPACDIISFEPNEELASEIRRAYRKDARVKTFAGGIGEKEIELPLYVPMYRGIQFDGLASFYRENAADAMTGNDVFFFDPRKLVIRELACRIIPLDSLGLDPFFVKIDVQGYELSVLKGGAETIRRSRPIILMESINEDHMKFLSQFGYRVYAFDPTRGAFLKDRKGPVNSFVMTDDRFDSLQKEITQS